MKPLHLDNLRVEMSGSVLPPKDIVNSARLSLNADAFDELMRETSGNPTPDQLVAKVESQRS